MNVPLGITILQRSQRNSRILFIVIGYLNGNYCQIISPGMELVLYHSFARTGLAIRSRGCVWLVGLVTLGMAHLRCYLTEVTQKGNQHYSALSCQPCCSHMTAKALLINGGRGLFENVFLLSHDFSHSSLRQKTGQSFGVPKHVANTHRALFFSTDDQ